MFSSKFTSSEISVARSFGRLDSGGESYTFLSSRRAYRSLRFTPLGPQNLTVLQYTCIDDKIQQTDIYCRFVVDLTDLLQL
jgi:hypothetical protein